jgi:hypothetical protein
VGIEVQTKKIGGLTFKLSQLPAWTAFRAFHRFLSIVGPVFPALAAAFRAVRGKTPGEPLSDDAKAKLLDGLASGLPEALMRCKPEELEALAKELLAPCIITMPTGKSAELLDVLDEVLSGKLPVLIQLLGWAVKVHFGDFLPGLMTSGALEALEPSPSSSPKT